jgi:YVTN family beta-propeller protein
VLGLSGKLTCLWVLLALPAVAGTTRIWVLNIGSDGSNSIDVIDPATNKIVQTIEGIREPHGVAFSPDGNRAYVTSESEESKDALYLVDTTSGKILKKAPLSGRRGNVPAITIDGKRLLVCVGSPRDANGLVMSSGGTLDIVDSTSLKIIKSLPMQGHDCYTTPDGKYWIAGSGKLLVIIDVQTGEPLWQVPFKEGIATVGIETRPDGSPRRLFVTPLITKVREFAIVDFATHKEVTRIQLPDKPSGFLVAPPLERRNEIPTHGTAISPDGKILAIASRASNAVFLYSLPDLKVTGYFPAATVEGEKYPNNGSDPGWLTFTPDSKTMYLANAAANSVSVVDVKTLKETARIPVGKQPDHVWTLERP